MTKVFTFLLLAILARTVTTIPESLVEYSTESTQVAKSEMTETVPPNIIYNVTFGYMTQYIFFIDKTTGNSDVMPLKKY